MKSATSKRVLLGAVLIGFCLSPLLATGQPPAEQEVVDVDWFINLTWFNYPGVWGEDKFSLLVEDKYGLKLNFILPAQEGGAQINTMIAGGELPDIITVESWLEYRRRMAQAGLLSSYNDLIDAHDRSFWDIMKMDIFNWFQENDGETYGLPNFAYSSSDMTPGKRLNPNRAFTVRADLLDQIGRPGSYNADGFLDATADEFLDILEEVKGIGTYNGLPIVPLQLYEFSDRGSESIGRVGNYFAAPFEDPSGDWIWDVEQENYFQAIAFLNEAFNRGLLSPEAFTDTREQINQKVASGRVFSLFTATQDFGGQFDALYKTDPDAKFEGFVLRDNAGDDPQLPDIAGFGWLTTSVAASANVPDRIIKLIHFLYSEDGQIATHLGYEGETFNWVNGRGSTIEWIEDVTPEERASVYGVGFNMLMDWLSVMDWFPQVVPGSVYPDVGYMASVGLPYSYDAKPISLHTDPEDPLNDEMQTLGTAIQLFWGKQWPRMITAPTVAQARTIWQAAIEESYKMGMADLIEYNNDRFQRTKEKLLVDFAWPPNKR